MLGGMDDMGGSNQLVILAEPIKATSPAIVAGLVDDGIKASQHHVPAHTAVNGRYDSDRHRPILRRVVFAAVHDGSQSLFERREQ